MIIADKKCRYNCVALRYETSFIDKKNKKLQYLFYAINNKKIITVFKPRVLIILFIYLVAKVKYLRKVLKQENKDLLSYTQDKFSVLSGRSTMSFWYDKSLK